MTASVADSGYDESFPPLQKTTRKNTPNTTPKESGSLQRNPKKNHQGRKQ